MYILNQKLSRKKRIRISNPRSNFIRLTPPRFCGTNPHALPTTHGSPDAQALYQSEPAVGHQTPRLLWNNCMTAAFGCLAKKDGATAATELPRFCTSIVECFSTQQQELAQNACDCLKSVLSTCVAPQQAAFEAAAQAAPGSTVAHQVIAALASGDRKSVV